MLNELTISELISKISKREVSAREAAQACLDQIGRVEDKIRAFISYDVQDALAQADAADKSIGSGVTYAARPLLGVPIGIKDVIAVNGLPRKPSAQVKASFDFDGALANCIWFSGV